MYCYHPSVLPMPLIPCNIKCIMPNKYCFMRFAIMVELENKIILPVLDNLLSFQQDC